MGFWDQLNCDSVDRRRSRIRPRFARPSAPNTMHGDAQTYRNLESAGNFWDSASQLPPLPIWGLDGFAHGHKEWEYDPDLLAGYELAKRLDFDAIEKFGDALNRGNLLALVALGDFFSSVLCISIQWRPYRIGSDQYLDGMVKVALGCYLMVIGLEAFSEGVAERIQLLKNYCGPEDELAEFAAKVLLDIEQLSIEHPEEFVKLFMHNL